MPRRIIEYFILLNAEEFTEYCFRRSYATLLAESIINLKRCDELCNNLRKMQCFTIRINIRLKNDMMNHFCIEGTQIA